MSTALTDKPPGDPRRAGSPASLRINEQIKVVVGVSFKINIMALKRHLPHKRAWYSTSDLGAVQRTAGVLSGIFTTEWPPR